MLAFKKILVPVDFGPSSEAALHLAIDLAKKLGSELTLVHVWEVPAYAYSGMEFSTIDLLAPAREQAQRALDARLEALQQEGTVARGVLRCGRPWHELRAAIEEVAPDLVVMGTHGHRGLARALLGSVAEKTVRHSTVPVLTIRAKEEATTATSASAVV